ncbi:MAG: 16S rRNA (uracil(1498)-N(3))-methyltransferase [Spirochaetales bacterium]|nr:16S rRNA (uracil(1498)-N(3))-methyltransferase [Spirochaetales bacterium]
MRVLRLPSAYEGEEEMTLKGKDAHYVTGVLRLKVGSHLLAQDRRGVRYQGVILAVTTSSCTLRLTLAADTAIATDALPSYEKAFTPLVLLLCLLKGRKEEQVVRQATELGVEKIVLVSSEYCTVRLEGKNPRARFARLDAQVTEALQQSGSKVPTTLHDRVLDLRELGIWWADRGPLLFLHQVAREKSRDLSSYARTLDPKVPVGVLIGPEGGFSDEECAFLEEAGFLPVFLKSNILRSETAAIYALSGLQELLHR